jgi:transcriptional regulator GlxA family with amidase domain
MKPRVARMLTLLSGIRREISLPEIARSMNMSAWRRRDLFTIGMALSPLQSLKEYRMLRVQELLETTHFNLKQIMARVGIEDQSHARSDFRETYDLRPQRNRVQHQEAKTGTLTLVRVATITNK